MVPHPPMIVPDVGRGSEKQVQKTIAAYEKVAEEIGDKTPDEDLQRLIKSGASNGTDIPYEEFHSIMTKDVSLK